MTAPQEQRLVSPVRIGFALAACLAAGCDAVLGIHDVQRDPSGGGGAGRHPAGACVPDDRRCSDNRPQRCNDLGQWENEAPCPAAAPACDGGDCVPPSCVGLAETCGPAGNESCCASAAVPGGSFTRRENETDLPATVNGFVLDRFEVTVGRFRRFLEAYPEGRPAAGAGAHPLIEGSGWNADWDVNLPATAAALRAALKCNSPRQTWTDVAGDGERLPINCLNWYEAFAFCAWDGGRLATEAEWHYAAAGGAEQQPYPWSSSAVDERIDSSYAVYHCTADGSAAAACAFSDIQPVGSRSPKGDAKWGHADLAGSMFEWALDRYAEYPRECNRCANLTEGSLRVCRGGAYSNLASYLLSFNRERDDPSHHISNVGVRCARTP
ncbi:formylglycine-generating enzyme family protein [Sorangium sp. So ce1335]|uniref:formylglycine-generating enzyme family protein n=1 Tax=Sorangium sp. So ce1335 TaxID=3133335 RepID=UPI003F5F039C